MNSDVSENTTIVQALLNQESDSLSFLDHAIWNSMQDADSMDAFSRFWLELQCSQLESVSRAMVVFVEASDETTFSYSNYWPEGQDGSLGLTAVCELVFAEKKGVVRQPGNKKQQDDNTEQCHIGFPFLIDQRVIGVVAVELNTLADIVLRTTMRQLQWGATWIENFYKRQQKHNISADDERLIKVLELLGSCIENKHFQAAATTVVTELCIMLDCERVSIGFLQGQYAEVLAMSHTAKIDKKSNIVAHINAAMDESLDQLSTLVYPAAAESIYFINAHADLASIDGNKSICTVPLTQQDDVLGAITLERSASQSFDPGTIELCELVASLLGPVLDTKRKDERWLINKIWVAFKELIFSIFGRGHIVLKLSMSSLLCVIIFFAVAEGDYRVSADARLEGAIQRVVVAPIDGFIREAKVRAGDIVGAGEVLAKLDDQDLILERLNWVSKHNQFIKQYRDALANFKRAEVRVLKAKLGQAEAEIALLDAQLSRILLVAPFDGLVVSGDLSQLMGSPVSTGEVLFEIAPLNLYRVILEVDERDIREVAITQKGELILTGKADKVLPFQVTKLTPVAEQREGRNYFRVEAILDEKPEFLRPGMKGVGKIEIGERKIIWIWTHTLFDWVRLWLWNWWF